MRVSVKSWEKAPLRCRLFGHSITGYRGDVPYVRENGWGPRDGMGIWHLDLVGTCDNCDQRVTVAKIHRKEKSDG